MEGDRVRAIYHSGFWIRDEAYLRSGPRLSVNHDYFEVDGHPLAVVGTTYMSSEVQRLYFEHPNVYVWNQDLGQIHDAGLNMIRTGWWTGWDKFCDENGQPYERTLRTIEAYLMTARKYGLPVQFNFFAFLPDVLGGTNAFLDPEAVRRQQTLISAVVARFHDVPYLAWDLINEPSFSQASLANAAEWRFDRTRGLEPVAERALSGSRETRGVVECSSGLGCGNDLSSKRRRIRAARHVYGHEFAANQRLFSFRAGVVREVGAHDARDDSRGRIAAARYRRAGRRRHSGSAVAGVLGSGRSTSRPITRGGRTTTSCGIRWRPSSRAKPC